MSTEYSRNREELEHAPKPDPTALEVIAKLAIGAEACDDGLGVLILAGDAEGGFRVYVNGGLLPSGRDHRDFDGPTACVDALEYFLATGRALAVDAIECTEI